MRKIGNLFELAETRLIKEKRPYNLSDIIDYAILIRKWISHNPRKANRIMKLTREEYRKKYYIRTGK